MEEEKTKKKKKKKNKKGKSNRGKLGVKEIPVYCSHTDMIPIDELATHPRNINKHPRPQIEIIKKILRKFGWRLPLTVSKRSGYITRGAGRFQAAYEMELKEVPVDYQDYKSEEEELADMAADNKASELSFLDEDMEKDLLNELKGTEFDFLSMGYTEERLQELLKIDDSETTPFGSIPVDQKGELDSVSQWRSITEVEETVKINFGGVFSTVLPKKEFESLHDILKHNFEEFEIPVRESFKRLIKYGIKKLKIRNSRS